MPTLKLLVEIEFSGNDNNLTENDKLEVAESVQRAIEKEYFENGLAPREMLTDNYTVKPL